MPSAALIERFEELADEVERAGIPARYTNNGLRLPGMNVYWEREAYVVRRDVENQVWQEEVGTAPDVAGARDLIVTTDVQGRST